MADRFPIIIESTEQQIQELSAGDGLDLTKSGVVNANYVHSAGVNAGVVTATSFIGDGSQITNIPAGGGSLEATASGTLADGSTVIVNTDGTVSVVAQTGSASPSAGTPAVVESASTDVMAATFDSTNNKVVIAFQDGGNSNYGTAVVGTVSGTSISFGSSVVFESASVHEISATLDSSNNKVIIAYQDRGNGYYGTAVVGTVSGTSISFGTPVVFASSFSSKYSATFDSSNNKVVVAYQDLDNSDYGTVVVGTVSGTSISFGTPVVFASSSTVEMSATFDSSNGKVVIAYRDFGNSSYGTAIVGTVSGTSIGFGTPVVYNSSGYTYYNSAAYDSTNQKVVIAYRNNATTHGTAIVGTVSGTSISFGSPVVFEAAETSYISVVYDTANQKVVIAYRDSGNSGYGTAIVGTVSGTSISFGSSFVYNSSGNTYYNSAVYDSTNQKVVIAYSDSGNSGYGTAVVVATNTLSTNLTAENYIGISDGSYTNGQTATIQIAGSVDDAQSSLTPGQQYYVQTDGTLSETADSPSVLAGTAVAATKLMIG